MSDIVTRLWGNTGKYPGFENLNTEAAAEIKHLRARVAELEDCEHCLIRNGFTRCSSPACNCGSWHQTSGLAQRFEELQQDLDEAGHPLCNQNGHVFRTAFKSLVADRDSWRLLGVEVKDMIGRLDAGVQLTKQDIECLRTLVYRADVRTGEVGHER